MVLMIHFVGHLSSGMHNEEIVSIVGSSNIPSSLSHVDRSIIGCSCLVDMRKREGNIASFSHQKRDAVFLLVVPQDQLWRSGKLVLRTPHPDIRNESTGSQVSNSKVEGAEFFHTPMLNGSSISPTIPAFFFVRGDTTAWLGFWPKTRAGSWPITQRVSQMSILTKCTLCDASQ